MATCSISPDLQNSSHASWGVSNFGANPPKFIVSAESYRKVDAGGVQFRPDNMEDESGVCSPPLWKTSPSRSPLHPRHAQNTYRHPAAASRAQAIARGQWELMEMVKNMPESSYELSLKDLVEQTRLQAQEDCLAGEKMLGKKNGKKAKMTRSGSIDNRGLFLNLFFPVSLRSKKKKKQKKLATNTCAKISPKPEVSDKSDDRDLWKERFCVSGESGIGGMSINSRGSSSSSHSSSNSRKMSGSVAHCWSFFHFERSKAKCCWL